MASDLWQLVKARDLKPGDVGFWCLEPRRIVSTEIIAGERMEIMYAYRTGGMKAELHPDDVVVRRYTGPSPEVLMRALRIAASWFTNRFTYASVDEEVKKAIAQAEEELAEEAGQ